MMLFTGLMLFRGLLFAVFTVMVSYHRKSRNVSQYFLSRTQPPLLKKWSGLNQNKLGDFSYPASIAQVDQFLVFPSMDKSV
jgi:hypothetical protein